MRRKSPDPSEFATCEYMGQHCGWHFYVAQRTEYVEPTMPSSRFYGVAIPPSDGKLYTTKENFFLSDPRTGVPGGTLQVMGANKAEAIYEAVSQMHAAAATKNCV